MHGKRWLGLEVEVPGVCRMIFSRDRQGQGGLQVSVASKSYGSDKTGVVTRASE